MESRADQVRAFVLALLLHAGAIFLLWLSARWIWPVNDAAAAGEPIQATLMVSAADIRRAQKAIKAAPAPAAVIAPQPLPSKLPQTSDTPLQANAQKPQDQPDTVDQAAASKTAPPTPDPAVQEQKERIRQAQVDLTEDIARQREAESRQRLRDQQLEALKREQEQAAKVTRMEEQRLAQLEDLRTAPKAAPAAPTPTAPVGNRGVDDSLLARYKVAMQQAADANWNRTGAPERVRCKVAFTQITGGEVIDVQFLDCPFDEQGRDSVDRALRRNPMPYSGYESVFIRRPTITFCYPQEDCQP
jgi:colicin import membrane protein